MALAHWLFSRFQRAEPRKPSLWREEKSPPQTDDDEYSYSSYDEDSEEEEEQKKKEVEPKRKDKEKERASHTETTDRAAAHKPVA